MVFYRKFRPQKIEDLDNESVRQTLYSIFQKGNFNDTPHAFLFTGPKGLGKTSAARIVAKVINCEKHKNLKGKLTEKEIEPDNKCSQCVTITNGSNLDVLEIDGASNRGIDEIRDLKEKINLAPFKALKKVYIIDEVHMLTTEAFNALLKTLEEPPAHALFILCTTEVSKVPQTIMSRCFRINFTKATNEELVRSFQRIVKQEEIKIDKEALFEIARLSDGSFRDGAKILEEISTFAGRKTITKNLVNEKLNTIGITESIIEFLDLLALRDVKKSLHLIRELTKQGMDFKFFIETLIERLHFMLLIEAGIEKSEEKSKLTLKEIKELFELLSDAYSQTKYAVLPQVPLEIVVLEWANKADETNLEERPVKIVSPASNTTSKSLSESDDFLNKLITEVKLHNNLFAGILRGCKLEVSNSEIKIFAASKFHKEKLEDVKNLKILNDATDKILNKKVKFTIMLKGGE